MGRFYNFAFIKVSNCAGNLKHSVKGTCGQIKLIKSRIGALPKQRQVLDALGLNRINKVKEFKDNASVRGMIAKVSHMVEVSE